MNTDRLSKNVFHFAALFRCDLTYRWISHASLYLFEARQSIPDGSEYNEIARNETLT